MSISRLDCSLDLVIQSICTANTVTRFIAVFNSILVKAGDPMSSFLESQNSAVRGAEASCKMAIRSSPGRFLKKAQSNLLSQEAYSEEEFLNLHRIRAEIFFLISNPCKIMISWLV
jgi:hypothetical protein